MNNLMRLSLIAVLSVGTLLAEETPVDTLNLGGPRKVFATVTKTNDNEVEVSIKMLAVQCFDAVTNMQLSRQKATTYVHRALAEYEGLADEKIMEQRLSGLTIKATSLDGNRYGLTVLLSYPKQMQTEVIPSGSSTTTTRSVEFLTANSAETQLAKRNIGWGRKQNRPNVVDDFTETSQFLLQAFRLEILNLPVTSDSESRAAYYRMIADLEEKAEQDFHAMVREVKVSKLLLSVEIDLLVDQISADHESVNKLLVDAANAILPPL